MRTKQSMLDHCKKVLHCVSFDPRLFRKEYDDSFIVYTSNVFAILGLRSLYFALAGMEQYFKYLKYGLSVILVFVGLKMCFSTFIKVPTEVSIIIIAFTLIISMISSRLFQDKS